MPNPPMRVFAVVSVLVFTPKRRTKARLVQQKSQGCPKTGFFTPKTPMPRRRALAGCFFAVMTPAEKKAMSRRGAPQDLLPFAVLVQCKVVLHNVPASPLLI